MDIGAYNRRAWDAEVDRSCHWTISVDSETVASARRSDWNIVLTPAKAVPRAWFPPLNNCRVLGLASGVGQQGPILAAAGASVTILDNSPAQLDRDRQVSKRDDLAIKTVLGEMADLSEFDDASFDLIVHPCSNSFVPEIRPVWNECYRVLSPGGVLMSGFANPAQFIFDAVLLEKGEFVVRNQLPYSELLDLSDAERQAFIDRREPLMFGHTLGDQIGGQLEAGFVLTDMFEDSDPDNALSQYMHTYIATRVIKPTI